MRKRKGLLLPMVLLPRSHKQTHTHAKTDVQNWTVTVLWQFIFQSVAACFSLPQSGSCIGQFVSASHACISVDDCVWLMRGCVCVQKGARVRTESSDFILHIQNTQHQWIRRSSQSITISDELKLKLIQTEKFSSFQLFTIRFISIKKEFWID